MTHFGVIDILVATAGGVFYWCLVQPIASLLNHLYHLLMNLLRQRWAIHFSSRSETTQLLILLKVKHLKATFLIKAHN